MQMRERSENWPESLSALEEVLNPLLSGLKDYFRQFPDEEEEEAEPEPALTKTEGTGDILQYLFRLIEDNDAEAVDMLAGSKKSICSLLGKEKFRELSDALSIFDFEGAREILRPSIPGFFE